MAVVNLKSTLITNRDATPKVLTDPYVSGAELRESEGYVAVGSADSIASVYRLCKVPSNARVTTLLLQNTAVTSAAANIGVYWPTVIPTGSFITGTNAAAISATLFGSAVSIASASTVPVNQINQAVVSIANQELPLWQLAGLSADPGIDLDICMALTAAATAAGFVSLKAHYME